MKKTFEEMSDGCPMETVGSYCNIIGTLCNNEKYCPIWHFVKQMQEPVVFAAPRGTTPSAKST